MTADLTNVPPPLDPAVRAWDDGYNNGLDEILGRAFGIEDGYRELNGILEKVGVGLYAKLGLDDSPMLVVIAGLRAMITGIGLQRKTLETIFRAIPGNSELRTWIQTLVPDVIALVLQTDFETERPVYEADRLKRRVGGLERDLSALAPRLNLSAAGKQIARDLIARLDDLNAYKNIHDALHDLQMRVEAEFGRVASEKILEAERETSIEVQLQEVELAIDRIRRQFTNGDAIPAAVQARDDVLGAIRWIADAIGAMDFKQQTTAETAAGLLRAMLRQQMSLFDSRLVETSEQIPFAKFAQAIDSLDQPAVPRADTAANPILLSNVSNSFQDVAVRLNNRQRAHRLWQQAEATILNIEELLSGKGREVEIGIHWQNLERLVNEIAVLSADPKVAKLLANPNFNLARSADPREIRAEAFCTAFNSFVRLARVYFQRADSALLEDCSQIRRLQNPLQMLL